MPLYTFACDVCGSTKDVFQKIANRTDHVKTECASCGSETNHTFNISAPMMVSGVNAGHKISGDLKNRFDQMRKHYPQMKSTY